MTDAPRIGTMQNVWARALHSCQKKPDGNSRDPKIINGRQKIRFVNTSCTLNWLPIHQVAYQRIESDCHKASTANTKVDEARLAGREAVSRLNMVLSVVNSTLRKPDNSAQYNTQGN